MPTSFHLSLRTASHTSGILFLLVFPRLPLPSLGLPPYSFSAPFLFNVLSCLSFHSTSTSPFLFFASENTTKLKSLLWFFTRHLYSSHRGLRYIAERETDGSSALIFEHASPPCDIVRVWSIVSLPRRRSGSNVVVLARERSVRTRIQH